MASFINENNTDDTSNDEGEKYFAVSLMYLSLRLSKINIYICN